jgi:hypothetical protein
MWGAWRGSLAQGVYTGARRPIRIAATGRELKPVTGLTDYAHLTIANHRLVLWRPGEAGHTAEIAQLEDQLRRLVVAFR